MEDDFDGVGEVDCDSDVDGLSEMEDVTVKVCDEEIVGI